MVGLGLGSFAYDSTPRTRISSLLFNIFSLVSDNSDFEVLVLYLLIFCFSASFMLVLISPSKFNILGYNTEALLFVSGLLKG